MLRTTAVFAAATAVLFATACGGGSDEAEPTASPSTPGATASPAAARPSPFAAADFTRLAAIAVPGYTSVRQTASATSLLAVYESQPLESGVRLTATVTISACDPFICPDLDAANFLGKEAQLKTALPEVHIKNPALVFTMGNADLAAGYRGFFTYARSFVRDGGTTSTANRYSIQYHDGVNQVGILIGVRFEGPFPQSEAEMQRQLDQPTGEAAARAFFAPFQPAFRPNR